MEEEKVIDSFIDEYEFLSNFYREQSGTTVEHFYQAAKATNTEDYLSVLNAETPRKAKNLGRKIECRGDWQNVKYWIMKALVAHKFLSDPELMDKLLATGDNKIVEGNYWHDQTWGSCSCDKCKDTEGKNWLGEILMDVRDQHRGLKSSANKNDEITNINNL